MAENVQGRTVPTRINVSWDVKIQDNSRNRSWDKSHDINPHFGANQIFMFIQ